MTEARDATGATDAAEAADAARSPVSRGGVSHDTELVTPYGWSFTMLRVTALIAALAAVFGRLVIPGAHGTLDQRVVEHLEDAAGTLSYVTVGLVVALLAAGSFEIARLHRTSGLFRGALIGVTSLALAIASPSPGMHLGAVAAVALSLVTSVVALLGAAGAMRAPHTRAAAVALAFLGFANIGRLTAWSLAGHALADPANAGRYPIARTAATFGTAMLMCALGVGTVWLGTRPKLRGALLALASLAAAAALAYVTMRDAEVTTPILAMARHALAGAEGAPAPYGLGPLATFAVPLAIALALSSSSLRSFDTAGPVLALAVTSFGAFDVPLAALLVLASSIWLPLLAADPRAMWQSLVFARRRASTTTGSTTSAEPKADDR
jgi:hypothetical protein